MKKVELNMSDKFRDYCIENCTGKISAKKIIAELLKKEGITKPKIRMDFCSIADLKYNGREIVGASMNIAGGKIYLEVK